MKQNPARLLVVLALVAAAGFAGYALRGGAKAPENRIPMSAATIAAPAADSVRVLYSLDKKQNDRELVALIDAARAKAYFAIYDFTLKDVADALVRAKKRGVDVRGLVDAREAASSYEQPIIRELVAANIPVETERHADGNGIMHIKALVTDRAYAIGSYNWTYSATNENDEILEIGTDPALRQRYEKLLERLFASYAGTNAAAENSIGTLSYTDAPDHIGDFASVTGTLFDAHTSRNGMIFLDFCKRYRNCPFSAVIFADDAKQFGDLSAFAGKTVTVTGRISAYRGRAEMVLTEPSQLK